MTTKAKTMQLLQNLSNGLIDNNMDRVFKIISQHEKGINTFDLRNLGFAHQTITATLSNLNDTGLVKIIGVININNNWYSTYQRVSDEVEIIAIQNERKKHKLEKWINAGLKDFKNNLTGDVIKELEIMKTLINN